MQVVDGDLIGALAGAAGPLLAARPNGGAWLETAQLVLDAFVRVHMLLDAVSSLPEADAAIVDAGWKRCGELGVHADVMIMRALVPLFCSAKNSATSLPSSCASGRAISIS